jgi:hypothetical protein
MHVGSVYFKYFRCFRDMLQVFHKDVAHVAMSYTRMFQVYVTNVSSVLDVCYKCFIWMLQN